MARLRRLVGSGARVVDDLECMASVLLAILIAHRIGAQNVSWAAFSGYMVMRGHVAESFLRGLLRIVGTGAGAALGLLLVPHVLASPVVAAIAASLVGGATLYGSLTGKRAYAWLFVGLTFQMILLDTLEHPGNPIRAFASTRMLEVLAGTCACLLVSCLSTLTARRRWPGARAAAARRVGWHSNAARHAAQAAVALALLPLFWRWFAIPELAQSAVTIMAVMLVPVSTLGASGLAPVSRRLLQRIAGCLAGSGMAAIVLFAAHGSAPVLIAGTAIGVAIGRHIENGPAALAYGGTQFALAILVTLVPDSYADAALAPAVHRLIGILIGMALLEPILILWRLFTPHGQAAHKESGGGPGGGE